MPIRDIGKCPRTSTSRSVIIKMREQSMTYLVIVEPNLFQVWELFKLLEQVQTTVAEVNFCEVSGVFVVLDGQDGPGVTDFQFSFHFNL